MTLIYIYLFQKTFRTLQKEVSITRRDDGYEGKFGVEDRLDAASKLAALSVIGNRPRISMSKISDEGILLLQEPYLASNLYEKLLKEALYTSLFTPIGNDSFIWFHRSIGEYLAANFIYKSKMSLKQIKSLFINPNDPEDKTSPLLHETVAWLAVMRQDIFDWIMRTEPLVLINSETVRLSDLQKATSVDVLIQSYAEDGVFVPQWGWKGYKYLNNLNHPNLGEQLRPYLLNKKLRFQARDLVMEIAIVCNVETIDEALIGIALDKDEKLGFRIDALRALSRRDNIENIENLRKLVFERKKHNANHEIAARAIEILWPQQITTEELFNYLWLPRQNEFPIGSAYDNLLRREIVEHIGVKDLPIALNWIVQHSVNRDHKYSISSREFIMSIMRLAWEHLDNKEIRVAFAHAAWARLRHYNPVIQDRKNLSYGYWQETTPKHDYIKELKQNNKLRYQLLDAMLNCLTDEGLRNEKLLFQLTDIGSVGLPLISAKDINFLIEKQRTEKLKLKQHAYAYLISRVITLQNTAYWSQIYNECVSGENYVLARRFQGYFYVGLKSKRGIIAKKNFRQYQKWEEERKEQIEQQEAQKYPAESEIEKWLVFCLEDSSQWWILNQILLANEFGKFFDMNWDITTGYGWQTIKDDKETVYNIIHTSMQYIQEQHPYIGEHDVTLPLMNRRQALAGYRAMILLARFDLLNSLSSETWEKWAEVVVFNTFSKNEDVTRLDNILLRKVFKYSENELLEKLEEQLEVQSSNLYALLPRFEFADSTKFEQILITHLEQLSPDSSNFNHLLEILLSKQTQVAEEAQLIAITHIKSPQNQAMCKRIVCKRIIHTLSKFTHNNGWWQNAWEFISSDLSLAKEIFENITDWHHNQYLNHLTEEQLFNLYEIAIKLYPYSADKEFHGGAVPKWHVMQDWRDSILKELAYRGTISSLDMLMKLHSYNLNIPNFDYILQQARNRFREVSWIAPQPQIILELAQDSQSRYVRNADQLLELIVDTLKEIEKDYRGTASMQRSIWDKEASTNFFHPVEEEAFSDAIADWLQNRIPNILVNREVEVRKDTTKPRGERTDIHIETFSDSGESLLVIIEVKGCWYRELYKRMQTQLVDQYINPHPNCNHGIYLVGYFFSSHWTTQDKSRKNLCDKRDKATLENKLLEKSQKLQSSKPMVVQPFVFDAALS